jgi:hypothetical protein
MLPSYSELSSINERRDNRQASPRGCTRFPPIIGRERLLVKIDAVVELRQNKLKWSEPPRRQICPKSVLNAASPSVPKRRFS